MMDVRRLSVAALPLLASMFATPALAGPYSDDLSKCLVAQASSADRTLLVRWMFSAISAGPAVSSLSQVTPGQRHEISAQAGALYTRLIAKDCRSQTVAAVKYEGFSSLEDGFRVLGQVAVRDLMSDPAVRAQLSALDDAMDKDQLKSVGKEAGLPDSK